MTVQIENLTLNNPISDAIYLDYRDLFVKNFDQTFLKN